MRENVDKFLALYNSDPSVKEEVEQNALYYPGSYEIRGAFVSAVLLPVAEAHGLPFTLEELRAYETKIKMERFASKNEDYFATVEDDTSFWLVDNGWQFNEEAARGKEEDK